MNRLLIFLATAIAPSATEASSGWSEGSWMQAQGSTLLCLWVLNFIFVPFFIADKRFDYRFLPWLQIGFQLSAIAVAIAFTSYKKAALSIRVGTTIVIYAFITCATNVIGGVLAHKYPSLFIGP